MKPLLKSGEYTGGGVMEAEPPLTNSTHQHQGAETSCMFVCTKRVCVSDTEPKACTVGIYST